MIEKEQSSDDDNTSICYCCYCCFSVYFGMWMWARLLALEHDIIWLILHKLNLYLYISV